MTGCVAEDRIRDSTYRKEIQALLEIPFVVSLESGSPNLEFGFERHD